MSQPLHGEPQTVSSIAASEILSRAEIDARFEGEWVLIEDPEVDERLDVLRGRVLFHSPDRDAFDRKMLELRPRRSAVLYPGPWPDDLIVVL